MAQLLNNSYKSITNTAWVHVTLWNVFFCTPLIVLLIIKHEHVTFDRKRISMLKGDSYVTNDMNCKFTKLWKTHSYFLTINEILWNLCTFLWEHGINLRINYILTKNTIKENLEETIFTVWLEKKETFIVYSFETGWILPTEVNIFRYNQCSYVDCNSSVCCRVYVLVYQLLLLFVSYVICNVGIFVDF